MNFDQAQHLLSELSAELGGERGAYRLDDHGELNLAFQESLPVHIRFMDDTLILACVVATEVDADAPGLFPTLMNYQFMGIRTVGCVLSWNAGADALMLSRQVYGQPSAQTLSHELELLLRAAQFVKPDLDAILSGAWDNVDSTPAANAPGALELPAGARFIRA